MLLRELIDEIMEHLQLPDEIGLGIPSMMTYVNSAARDARNSGWLVHLEDDESITFAQDTWEYAVPASFAYVRDLRVENDTTSPSTWDEIIPEGYWAPPRIDAGVPKFFLIRPFMIPVGLKMKVVGQKRPSLYSALTDTIDSGMESFLRERAIVYSMSFLRASAKSIWTETDSGVDSERFAMWDRRRRDSELMLGRHPQEFRTRPSSWYVPGR